MSNQDLEKANLKSTKKFYEGNAGDGTNVFDQYITGLPLIMVFSGCFLSCFLIGLDQTIVITLLETVGEKFDAYDKIGWVSSGYMLTMAVFSATWGRVAITFGRKYSLIIAIILFEAGSLMCALATSMNILIGGRVLAGIGGGGCQALTWIICTEMVTMDRRPLFLSILGAGFSLASVLGPIIGGSFTEHSSWRWCFYINLPLGGVSALIIIIFFNPPSAKGTFKEKLESLDYVGTFAISVGIVLFLLALTFGGNEFPWKSAAVILCFILGFVFLVLFFIWNFRFSKAPIIPIEIFREMGVVMPVLSLFFCFLCFIGLSVYLTTYFQIIIGSDPLSAALHLLPIFISIVLTAISSGVFMKTTGYVKPLAILTAGLGCIGLGLLTMLDIDSSSSQKIGFLILPGVSIGALLQTGITSSQLNAPKTQGATILTTAFFNFSRSLGGAIGADLFQTIFNSSLKNKIENSIKNNTLVGITDKEAQLIIKNPSLINRLDGNQRILLLRCAMASLKNVFITSLAVSFITFAICVLYSSKTVPKSSEIAVKEDTPMKDDESDNK
ncbi:hypothetical protein WICMUC_004678 [Wickerhamomyces mucosus]|uniref:Major facilitator superfamily (MFS) profile domain-containing protein n=1 Tax=Wickerhamomyces mucosus TaxID=1378264 RepID=A0A9P8PG88_9ASCO|nr:hypothetical protein WICMUC_004678 [Wickerhamomyces mucosus]